MKRLTIKTIISALVVIMGVRLCAADSVANSDLWKQLRTAKEINEDYYLRNVSIVTVARDFDDTGKLYREAKYQYFGGRDRFAKRILEHRDIRQNGQSPAADIWIGRPEGIFQIRQQASNQYAIFGSFPWSDKNVYDTCPSDHGISLPIADLELPLITFLQMPGMTITSQVESDWFDVKKLTKVSAFRDYKGGIEYDFYFDTNRGWLYRGKEQRNLMTKARVVGRVFYQSDEATPWKWESQMFLRDKPPYIAHSAEVIEFRKEKHLDREFSFAQFGLPEPIDGGPSKSINWGLWALVTVAGMFSMLLMVRRLKQNKA